MKPFNIKERNLAIFLGILSSAEIFLALRHGHIFGVLCGVVGTQWAIAKLLKWYTDPAARKKRSPLYTKSSAREIGFVAFICILVGIRVVTYSVDQRYRIFPETCLVSEMGCARNLDAREFEVGLTAQQVYSIVQGITSESYSIKWISSTVDQEKREIHLHYQETTRIFGFPDNVSIRIFCDSEDRVQFWVHSELRLGEGDMGKNRERVKSLLSEINFKAKRYGEIIEPYSSCWQSDRNLPIWASKSKDKHV
jgi:hypothetical protein